MFVQNIKIVFVILLASHAHFANAGLSKEDMKEMAKSLMLACKEEVKASDADIEAFRKKELPQTKEGLCVIECFFSKAGLMSNGKFSKDGFIAGLSKAYEGDEDKIAKIKSVAEDCDKKLSSPSADKCENGKNTLMCLIETGKNHGFDFKKEEI